MGLFSVDPVGTYQETQDQVLAMRAVKRAEETRKRLAAAQHAAPARAGIVPPQKDAIQPVVTPEATPSIGNGMTASQRAAVSSMQGYQEPASTAPTNAGRVPVYGGAGRTRRIVGYEDPVVPVASAPSSAYVGTGRTRRAVIGSVPSAADEAALQAQLYAVSPATAGVTTGSTGGVDVNGKQTQPFTATTGVSPSSTIQQDIVALEAAMKGAAPALPPATTVAPAPGVKVTTQNNARTRAVTAIPKPKAGIDTKKKDNIARELEKPVAKISTKAPSLVPGLGRIQMANINEGVANLRQLYDAQVASGEAGKAVETKAKLVISQGLANVAAASIASDELEMGNGTRAAQLFGKADPGNTYELQPYADGMKWKVWKNGKDTGDMSTAAISLKMRTTSSKEYAAAVAAGKVVMAGKRAEATWTAEKEVLIENIRANVDKYKADLAAAGNLKTVTATKSITFHPVLGYIAFEETINPGVGGKDDEPGTKVTVIGHI